MEINEQKGRKGIHKEEEGSKKRHEKDKNDKKIPHFFRALTSHSFMDTW